MSEPHGVVNDERARLRTVAALAAERTTAAIASLVVSLGDDSWQVRRAAAESLVSHANSDTVRAALNAMAVGHRNLGVLNGAMQVLAQLGSDAIATALLEFLSGHDVELRIYAALTLGARGDPRAVPSLVRALSDPDLNVRFHAIEALKQLRAGAAVEALTEMAEARDFALSFPALDALAAIGDSRISYRLVPLLEDALLQVAAAEALGQLGDEEAVGPLAAQLNHSAISSEVIAQALAAIHLRYEDSFGNGPYVVGLARQSIDASGLANLLDALSHSDGAKLRALAVVLGWLDGDTVDHGLVQLLSRVAARDLAADALARRGSSITTLLIQELGAEDSTTRKMVVQTLGRIGDARAVQALIDALEVDDGLLAEVVSSLALVGDASAYVPLRTLLGHPDASVRRAVVSALNSLGHPETATDMTRLLSDPNPRVRESAVRVIGYVGAPDGVTALLQCCADPDVSVRRAAVEHLPYLDDSRTLTALQSKMGDVHAGVRVAAARALGKSDDPTVTALLRIALDDPDPWVRYFAAQSLGRHGDDSAVQALTRLTREDLAPQVRVAAVEAIVRLAGAAHIAVLAELAADANLDVARSAIAALGLRGSAEALPALFAAANLSGSPLREAAILALGESGQHGAIVALRPALLNPDGHVVRAAITALARLALPEAVDILLNQAALPIWRANCMEELVRLGRNHAPLIARGLQHENPDVRRAIVGALVRTKVVDLRPLLASALEDADAGVRHAAIAAFAHGMPPSTADSGGRR
ncbi:MAG: HEAT repeat domain-containing protein [Gemmataceae bacterium]|nr:HEAT repeat domain-containing protein [Gemmataceae bacterium]